MSGVVKDSRWHSVGFLGLPVVLLCLKAEHSEELVEQMRTFCLGVTDMIKKALPAGKREVLRIVCLCPRLFG